MNNQATNNDAYFNDFTKPVRKIGKSFLMMAMIFGFIPAIYVAVRYNAMASWTQIAGGYVMILSTELAYYFVEPISYFPVLGEAGEYMSFLSGSISGIRVPTVTVSQDAVGTEPGSRKAEIVSTIAIAASVIMSMGMGLLAIILGNVLFAVLPEFVQHMFTYVIPVLYGCMIMMYVPKKPIVALFGFALALILRWTGIIPSFLNMLVCVILTAALGIFMTKKSEGKKAE